MSNVCFCVGKRAEKPYYMEKVCVSLYSIEELCYFLRENAYLIEPDICDHRLAEWIGRECGLPELAKKLEGFLRIKAGMDDFAGVILDYTGYYPPEERERIKNVMRINAAMNVYERRKARADYFLSHKRYALAVQEYEAVLAKLGNSDPILSGNIYHNLGVCHAGLFSFGRAAECFQKAAAVSTDRESALQYLAAMRLLLQENEYVPYLAEHPELFEDSLELEERVQRAEQAWLDTVPADGQPEEAPAGEELLRLKEEYRDMVAGSA